MHMFSALLIKDYSLILPFPMPDVQKPIINPCVGISNFWMVVAVHIRGKLFYSQVHWKTVVGTVLKQNKFDLKCVTTGAFPKRNVKEILWEYLKVKNAQTLR